MSGSEEGNAEIKTLADELAHLCRIKNDILEICHILNGRERWVNIRPLMIEKVHSHYNSNFESDLMKELCKMRKVDKTKTTAYDPQSNGVAERFNPTSKHEIMELRATPHSFPNESANYMMFGRELNLPNTRFAWPQQTYRQELNMQQILSRCWLMDSRKHL